MQITCDCGKRLRVSDETIGKRVKCPACGEKVLVQEAPPPAPVKKKAPDDRPLARAGGSSAKRPAPRADEEDEPRPRNKSQKKTRGPSPFLWIGLGGGAAALAALALVLILVFHPKGPDTPGPAAPPSTPGQTPGSVPAAQGVQVELSDGQLDLTGPMHMHGAVTYRFTQGRPQPGTVYTVFLNNSYGENKAAAVLLTADGGDLKPEGTVQDDYRLFAPVPEGGTVSYTIEMSQGPTKSGPFHPISNTLKGTITAAGSAAPPSSDPAHDKAVTADLKMIGLSYGIYCGNHPLAAPSRPEDLYSLMSGEVGRVHAGLESGEYVIFWHANPFEVTTPGGPSGTLLGYEKSVPTSGGLALMCDAQVRYMTAQEFQTVSKAGKVGIDTQAMADPQAKKLHVKALVGEAGVAALAGVKAGDTVRVRGDCGSLNNKVVSLSVASIDHGTELAVTAVELTKAFRNDPEGAAKKYEFHTIVVQGIVSDLNALQHELTLEGADE